MTILKKILFILIILLAFSMPAFAIQTSELTAYLNSQNLTTSGAYAVNGNIGIGSLSPVQKLDVTGTVRATGFTMTGQTPVSGYVLMATDTAGDATWSTAGSVSGWTSTNTTDVYETNSGNVGIGTTITNRAAFTVMNGNVGIGTWAPNGTLNVVGSIGIGTGGVVSSKLLTVSDVPNPGNYTGAGAQGIQVVAGGGGGIYMSQAGAAYGKYEAYGNELGVGTMNGFPLGLWTNNNQQMTITTTGNVGIGSTTPQGAFVVTNGNVGIGTWAPGGVLDVAGTLAHAFVVAPNGNVGIGTLNPVAELNLNSGGTENQDYLIIGNLVKGLVFTDTGADLNFYSIGHPLWFNSGGQNTFFNPYGGNVAIGNYTPKGVLDVESTLSPIILNGNGTSVANVGIGTTTPQGAFVVTNGNVGIGTWAPTAPLTIKGPATTLTINENTPNSVSQINATNNLLLTSNLSGTIYFDVNSVSKMVVSGTGNVGIGSTYPGQALDVQGTIRTANFTMTGQTPVSGYVLMATDTSGDATWSTAGSVSGWTSSGSNMYETTPTNNVGIGTTTPQGAFVVTNGNVGIGTWVPNAALSVMNGFVGIGTVSPGTALGVIGNVGIGSSSANGGIKLQVNTTPQSLDGMSVKSYIENHYISIMPSMSQGAFNGLVRAGDQAIIYTNGNAANTGNLVLAPWAAGSGGIRMDSNGNVGVAVINPAGALDVEGTLPIVFDSTSTSTGNVGVGTTTPQGSFVVTNGNVGIGTWAPGSEVIVKGGNVGIGTSSASVPLSIQSVGAVTQESALMISNPNTTSYATTNLLFSANGFKNAEIQGQEYSTTSGGILGFDTTNTSGTYVERMRMDQNGNVGIGTSVTFYTGLAIMNGNVGIGTYLGVNGELVVDGGNVGIGSNAPGQALDVTGTVRATGFTMTGQTPVSGYVLMATDTAGDATWSTAGSVSGWTTASSNMYETTPANNVGIGTTTPQGAFVVSNGNVGIGTWAPGAQLDVEGTLSSSIFAGNVGIGTAYTTPSSINVANTSLYQIEMRNTGSTGEAYMGVASGGTARISGSSAVAFGTGVIASSEGSFNEIFRIVNGNMGIGTSSPQGGFVVTNGNVGIGTWAPAAALEVNGSLSPFVVTASGRIGVGVTNPSVLAQLHATGVGGGSSTALQLDNPGSGSGTGATVIFTTANQGDYNARITAVDDGSFGGALVLGTQPPNGNTANPSERLRITDAGNVGIGSWTVNSINNTFAVVGNIGVGTNQSSSFIQTPGPSGGMIVQNNVGIGSVAPNGKLDVEGTFNSIFNALSSSTGNVGIGTYTPQGAFVVTNGNVGIGTWAPAAALDIAGAMYTHTVTNGALTINWAAGNVQSTSSSCGAMTFTNMQDGGSYTLTVEGTTSGTCTFTETGLTFKTPPSYGATTTGTMTLFQFVRRGTNVFVTWQTGY